VANSQVKTKDQSDYKNICNAFVDDDGLTSSQWVILRRLCYETELP